MQNFPLWSNLYENNTLKNLHSQLQEFSSYSPVKFVYFLKSRLLFLYVCKTNILQTLRANNSRILRIKNPKFSGCYFDFNTNMYGDFKICNTVPLSHYVRTEAIQILLTAANPKFDFGYFLQSTYQCSILDMVQTQV